MTLIIKLLAVAYSMIGTVTVHLKSSKTKQKTESNSQNPKQKKGKCVRKLKQKDDDNKCVWNIFKTVFQSLKIITYLKLKTWSCPLKTASSCPRNLCAASYLLLTSHVNSVRLEFRAETCLQTPLNLASSLQPWKQTPRQSSPLTLLQCPPGYTFCILQSQVFVCFLPAANQKPPPSTSLHSAAAAGLDPGPANVQPGQLGAIFKELFDGNVTHVQLRCQRVFLLHGNCQLLKDLLNLQE